MLREAVAQDPDFASGQILLAFTLYRLGRARICLVLTSRLLERPVSAAVKAQSSAGKSFLVDQVLRLFPDSAYYMLSAMSESALAYGNESLAP